MDITQKVKDFFESYQNRFNNALNGTDDIEGTTDAFAECFVGANPSGVFCGSNNAEFRESIAKGNQFYRDIHTLSMSIANIEITRLNSAHFMAKVFWKSAYDKDSETIHIDFDVIYLLQHRNEALKIFAYITEDEQKTLQEYGIQATTTPQ